MLGRAFDMAYLVIALLFVTLRASHPMQVVRKPLRHREGCDVAKVFKRLQGRIGQRCVDVLHQFIGCRQMSFDLTTLTNLSKAIRPWHSV